MLFFKLKKPELKTKDWCKFRVGIITFPVSFLTLLDVKFCSLEYFHVSLNSVLLRNNVNVLFKAIAH